GITTVFCVKAACAAGLRGAPLTFAARQRRNARSCGYTWESPCWSSLESLLSFTVVRSLLTNSAMPRCYRFFASPGREEGAYPQGSVTDEQRWRGRKSAQPGGRGRCGLSGGVARSSQVAADMLLARSLPSSPQR